MRFRGKSIRRKIVALLLVPLVALTGVWTFATVLTLIVTPCALMVRENVRSWREFRRQRRRIAKIRTVDMPLAKAAE